MPGSKRGAAATHAQACGVVSRARRATERRPGPGGRPQDAVARKGEPGIPYQNHSHFMFGLLPHQIGFAVAWLAFGSLFA